MSEMTKVMNDLDAQIDKVLQEQTLMRTQIAVLQQALEAAYSKGYADGLQVGLEIKGVH
tara:strand:- start:560 stop:736 length:177 start_codon:yes stop_codon:yes gene_type:complete